MSGSKKNWYEPQTRKPWEVCYQLLCTDLGDGISCILSLNHNIHGKKRFLLAIGKMSFEAKKCWKCIFQGSGDPNVKISPFTAHHGGTSGATDLANIKETQSLKNNGCRQKCLDKTLPAFPWELLNKKRPHNLCKALSFVTWVTWMGLLMSILRLSLDMTLLLSVECLFRYKTVLDLAILLLVSRVLPLPILYNPPFNYIPFLIGID